MFVPANCFELRLRIVGSHEPSWNARFVRCVRGFSPIRSSKTSPTQSRSNLTTAVALLTASAAISLHGQFLTAVPSTDAKVVKRWALPGDPHGLALGADGTIYVGLAEPQAIVAIDPQKGAMKRRVVLDSADIASTKELVTLRTDRSRLRLFVANGSDESATILSLPTLKIVREITIEGEPIRDALPDPGGRFLYLLGRRVHVYDVDGKGELRTINFEDPVAIAASGSMLAVFGGDSVALYNAGSFDEIGREPLRSQVTAAVFGAGDRVLVALSRDSLYEKPLTLGTMSSTERICLPEGSGPQIAALAAPDLLLFAERRCNSSGAFSGSNRLVAPASLYGVNAYAIAYDPASNFLYVTDRAGYLTIYRVPRAPAVH
jgi:DNA-binding beta-propeller fold protein YncE